MTYKVFPGTPDIPNKTCDWCGLPAKRAYELKKNRKKMGTAMYLYSCSDSSCQRKCETAAQGYKEPKSRKVEQPRIVGPGGSQ